ncbi:MAG: O-antigen ligase family protein [Bacteroidota bacterium]|nr:O-antigen ligase family protein [Bacteroidota bacterium]
MNLSKLFNIVSSAIIFAFVFSIYNDNFLVDYLGSNSLKAIFLLFILFNLLRISRNLFDRETMMELIPFLVFFLGDFFNMLINPPVGEEQGAKLFEDSLLLLSMLFIVTFFINYNLIKTLYFIWGSLIVSSVIAFFNSPLSKWTFRKTGGTGDPNEFASQMLAFIFISIFLFKKNRNIVFLIISIIAFAYSILFAASMSSFIFLAVIGVFVLLRFLSLSFVKSMLISITAIVAVITTIIMFQDKLESFEIINNILGRTEETGTANTRFNSWNAGLKMVADKPILGVGLHKYGKYSPKYSTKFLAEDSVAPHNLFLELAAESGLIVFFAFVFFLFNLMSKYFYTIVHSDYFWIYMAVTSYLLMGLTLGLTYNKFFWLTIALLMNLHLKLSLEREGIITEDDFSDTFNMQELITKRE